MSSIYLSRSQVLALALMLFAALGCGRKLSGRDARREQIRANADLKRSELEEVAGKYYGILREESGIEQPLSFSLEIKDVPNTEEGEIDPILVPTLSGYLRLNFGGGNDPNTGERFEITRAEYDSKNKNLSVTVTSEKYKDILLDLHLEGRTLSGTFSAPHLQYAGEVNLSRDNPNENQNPNDGLNGTYSGHVQWDGKDFYQSAELKLHTIVQHPEGMRVTGTAKIFFGEYLSNEFLLFSYDHVDVNPLSQDITIRDENAAVSFVGRLGQDKIEGSWFSTTTGKIGKLLLHKKHPSPPEDLEHVGFLRGTYIGKSVSTGGQLVLPERTLINLNTNEDANSPYGLKLSGSIRFYIGEFGSIDYEELLFSSLQINYFTHTFNATTTGKYILSIVGEIKDGKIIGKISSQSLGEIADLEVSQ